MDNHRNNNEKNITKPTNKRKKVSSTLDLPILIIELLITLFCIN